MSGRSGKFACCHLLSISSLWSLCFKGLEMGGGKSGPVLCYLCWPSFSKSFRVRYNNIVFVSRRLDIKTMKKAVAEYERIAGTKVNFVKSEGLRLGEWTGSDTLPVPFCWSDGIVCILREWFGFNLQLERN